MKKVLIFISIITFCLIVFHVSDVYAINVSSSLCQENTAAIGGSYTGTVVRRLTDKKGRFSIHNLAPGKYRMKIKSDKIPDYHRLEEDEMDVTLSGGEKKEMEIKVLPIKRTIKMLPSTPVLIEETVISSLR